MQALSKSFKGSVSVVTELLSIPHFHRTQRFDKADNAKAYDQFLFSKSRRVEAILICFNVLFHYHLPLLRKKVVQGFGKAVGDADAASFSNTTVNSFWQLSCLRRAEYHAPRLLQTVLETTLEAKPVCSGCTGGDLTLAWRVWHRFIFRFGFSILLTGNGVSFIRRLFLL